MKILVDADSCSVTEIIESIASERKIPVYLYSDYNHNLQSEYSQVITVQAGKDAADYAVFSNCEKGDLVITQDIGLASLVLSKGAKAIHPCGRVYNEYTIDDELARRSLSAIGKKSHKHMKHRTRNKKTYNFEASFRLLTCCM